MRGGRPVLHGIDLTVRAGEHVAIVGPNGSGKSSLVQLLTREQYALHRGDDAPPVRLFGEERWDVAELRSRMGIVAPDLQHRLGNGTATGHLRAMDAVVSGFFASEVIFLHHRVTGDVTRAAEEALARVGAAHLVDRPVNAMSTGEARRVLIARALVTRPSVLVLDEPTTGLDVVARADLLTDLRRVARDGTTLLLITHHVEEVLPEIERVLLLREGRVVFDGPTGEGLTTERLSAVYGRPVRVVEEAEGYRLEVCPRHPDVYDLGKG